MKIYKFNGNSTASVKGMQHVAKLIRNEEKKVRRVGGRTRGPAAFTSEDRARFKRNLTELLR